MAPSPRVEKGKGVDLATKMLATCLEKTTTPGDN